MPVLAQTMSPQTMSGILLQLRAEAADIELIYLMGASSKGGSAMSDVSQGEGWWVASDGRWYPPQDYPNDGAGSPSQVPPQSSTSSHSSDELSTERSAVAVATARQCVNGHEMPESQVFCSVCGSGHSEDRPDFSAPRQAHGPHWALDKSTHRHCRGSRHHRRRRHRRRRLLRWLVFEQLVFEQLGSIAAPTPDQAFIKQINNEGGADLTICPARTLVTGWANGACTDFDEGYSVTSVLSDGIAASGEAFDASVDAQGFPNILSSNKT